jgi:hypothetical protein
MAVIMLIIMKTQLYKPIFNINTGNVLVFLIENSKNANIINPICAARISLPGSPDSLIFQAFSRKRD